MEAGKKGYVYSVCKHLVSTVYLIGSGIMIHQNNLVAEKQSHSVKKLHEWIVSEGGLAQVIYQIYYFTVQFPSLFHHVGLSFKM